MQFCVWKSARCLNVSVFYFTCCATDEIKQFCHLETEFVLVFYLRFIQLCEHHKLYSRRQQHVVLMTLAKCDLSIRV